MSCKHYQDQLNPDHRHHVYCEELNNCVLCVAEERGPMTYEEIAEYLDRDPNCKNNIRHLEHRALRKVKLELKKNLKMSFSEELHELLKR